MKKIYFACCLLVVCWLFPAEGMGQVYSWAKPIIDIRVRTNEYYNATDRYGNTFVFISFEGTLDVGKVSFPGTSFSDYSSGCLIKYDSDGETMWIKHIASPTRVAGLTVDKDGNSYLAGDFEGSLKIDGFTYDTGTNRDGFLAKFDFAGDAIWVKRIKGAGKLNLSDLVTDSQGNCFLSGVMGGEMILDGMTIGSSYNESGFAAKFTSGGNILWLKRIGSGTKLSTDNLGNLFLVGTFTIEAKINDVILSESREDRRYAISDGYLCKYSKNGDFQWVTQILGQGDILMGGVSVDKEGNSYVTGRFFKEMVINKDTLSYVGAEMYNETVFIAKYDDSGKPMWGIRAGNSSRGTYGNWYGNISAADSSVYVSLTIGYSGRIGSINVGNQFSTLLFTKISKFGKIEWLKNPSGDGSFQRFGVSSTDQKGNFYLSGLWYGNSIFGKDTLSRDDKYYIALTKLSDTTIVRETPELNTVSGKIFYDENANCKIDNEENSFHNFIVKAEPGPYYALTDSTGKYDLKVEKGNYTISQVFPSDKKKLLIQQTCPSPPSTYQVTFTGNGKDTTGFNFGNQISKRILLKVEVAADRRRRCFRNTTTVYYRNDGYAAATNVKVQVTYPKYVIPISASTAWTSRKDSLLTFNIGTLQPGQAGTITIVDSVICDNEAIRGLTQCVKAVITPKNSSTTPDPRWDKSEVELKAVCKNNGFVRLSILNPGTGDMADSAVYRIYLDAVKVFESKYKLTSKDSLSLEVPVNGKTIRLEADLRPYHPDGNRQPSITLEGCGSAGTVNISKGYVNQLPQDDAPEEIATSCLEIRDSYDPNDKVASPTGVGQQHLITEKDELEYLIRFQNTGTDVAYNVVVQDTLDEHLDIATLQIGAASHPFTWNVSGQGRPVITWTFNNINLPASNSNEPKSHGYVRFRIGQKADNNLGATISNQAAITFDFNSPILTNLITNTVGEIPQALSSVLVDICKGNYPTKAQAGENIMLQTVGATTLHANVAQKGRGQWKLISGKGTIAEPANPQSALTGLGAGSTILEWAITLCDSTSRSRVTVERVIPVPAITNPAVVVCTGETISLTATGTNLVWYADEQLTRKLAQGTRFQSTTSGDFYVTQTIDGYESKPAKATSLIQSRPVPPAITGPARLYCQGESIEPLQATGEGIRWYADSQLTQLLSTDASFQPAITTSTTFYATQTVANCEGAASSVLVIIQPAKVSVQTKGDTLIAPLADAYQWYFEDQPLAKATARQIIVRNTGNYHVVLKKESCTASSDPVYLSIYVPSPVLTFTPNPSPDRVQVALTANATGRVEVRLLNTLGKVVQQVSWQKTTTILSQELTISHLARGVYFVEVSTGEGVLVKKLVKN